jgi:hypothetical protein
MAGVAQLKAIAGLDTGAYKAGANQINAQNRSLKQSFAQIGAAIGVSFSIAAITRAIKSTIDYASEIRHTADNLEMATASYQALNSSALKYGVTLEGMGRLLGKVRESQGKAADGDQTYVDALKRLNINTADFVSADTDKALEMIAKGYKSAGGSAQAYAAAVELGGRRMKTATAFLNELAEKGMAGLIAEATAAGDVLNDRIVTQLELAGTKMEQFQNKARIGFAYFIGGAETATNSIMNLINAMTSDRTFAELQKDTKEMQKQEAQIAKLKKMKSEELEKKQIEADVESKISKLTDDREKINKKQEDRVKPLKSELSSMEEMGAFFGGNTQRSIDTITRDKETQLAELQVEATKEVSAKIDELKTQLESLRTNVK